MRRRVLIGLLDSGVDAALEARVSASAAFVVNEDGDVAHVPVRDDPTGHGSANARAVLERSPEAQLAIAQVFREPGQAPAAAAAAGLDWLVACGANLVNMSFGLRRDRQALREACARAADTGVVLVAAAPARGAGVYPAGYEGVIRATGDARCAPGEISHLDSAQADFGACPRAAGASRGACPAGGASLGAAYVTGESARFLGEGGTAAGVRAHLIRIARYRGPERRT